MPSALLWAASEEELFEILGSGRQEAAAVPVLVENIATLFSAAFIMNEIHLTKQLC